MSATAQQIRQAVAARAADAHKFLAELVSIPSLCGQETAAMECVERAFSCVGPTQRAPMKNSLRQDRDYSDPVPDIQYDGRWNVRACLKGQGGGLRQAQAAPSKRLQAAIPRGLEASTSRGGKTLLLNAHVDTVPPAQGQADPFKPVVRNGAMYGRGSCDAKGQVATAYLALAALRDLGVPLAGELVAHLVVEEEVGGNGTLAMVRRGEKADGCVVLEPTELRLITSSRGAVWFQIALTGKAGHSGQAGGSRSALKMAIRVVEILEGYHARLLAASRGFELFDKYPNPMPLTIGQCSAGNWPATAPSEAVLAGVLGLLPNKTAAQVMEEMTAAVRDEGGPDIAQNVKIRFTYRHDSSVCPTDHALVKELSGALGAIARPVRIDALTASCDAWFYNNQLKIPTVVFGGGSLGVAHSANENMPLAELSAAAETIANLAVAWCR